MGDEWGLIPGSWNTMENERGVQVTVPIDTFPARWTLERRQTFCLMVMKALNDAS